MTQIIGTRGRYHPFMPMKNIAGFLRTTPLFAAVPPDEIQMMATMASEDQYRAREYVFMQGDPAAWFCLVRTGRVKILRQATSGKEVVLEIVGPGEPFGGVAVLERRPYPASAQALEASTVVRIPEASIVALVARYPVVVREMALMIGRRLRSAHDSVESLAADPVEIRLATRLIRLAEEQGTRGEHGITLPFRITRQTLADMSGTTVETTIRVMSVWLKKGVVSEDSGRLVILSIQALRELVGVDPQ